MNKKSPANWSPSTSIPALDGVRGLACLLVVYFHAGLTGWIDKVYADGILGIMLFFCLSGFLMALHYTPEKAQKGFWKAFYIRRYVRLYPTFVCAVLIGGLCNPHLLWGEKQIYVNWLSELDGILLLIKNTVFWTIPFEFIFYAFYPVLAFLLSNRKMQGVSLNIFVISWLLLIWQVVSDEWHQYYYYMYFLGGILAAHAYKHYPLHIERFPRFWDMTALFTIACILAIIAYYPGTTLDSWIAIRDDSYFISPLLALCVLSISKCKGIISKILASAPLRFLGKISYSMYLVHMYVEAWSAEVFEDYMGSPWLVFIAVVRVSSVFYFVIERQFHLLAKFWADRLLKNNAARS